MVDLTASPALCLRVRHDPRALDERYQLTQVHMFIETLLLLPPDTDRRGTRISAGSQRGPGSESVAVATALRESYTESGLQHPRPLVWRGDLPDSCL